MRARETVIHPDGICHLQSFKNKKAARQISPTMAAFMSKKLSDSMQLIYTPPANVLPRRLVSLPALTLAGRTPWHHEDAEILPVLSKYQKIHFRSLKFILINWPTLSEDALLSDPSGFRM
jgi:hypothetical protein